MRIVQIKDASRLDALYRFRRDMFVEQLGWMSGTDTRLVDEFDDYAYNYAALDDQAEIVGSLRVVPDSRRGLPLERCACLGGFRHGKVLVELSRLLVHPRYQGASLGAQLMKAGYQRALSQHATHTVLDTYVGEGMADKLYRKMGFKPLVDAYFDPALKCALPVVSMVLDLQMAKHLWPTEHPALFRYFTTPDLAIQHA